jgi:hypothetical protein
VNQRIALATVQLDVTPAPVSERLGRAEEVARQAAQAEAQLVVLPELFNTGYAYREENFALAEPLDGPTALWMKQVSARLKVHLAGSLLLRDQKDIYNALLLFAPDGRMWRYDKVYPWGWERAYFRERHAICVADTDLGAIGLLLCWDMAHASLWRQYAGQVDLMLACSCPPDIPDSSYIFPDGTQVPSTRMGPVMRSMRQSARRVFLDTPRQQSAWLGVPFVSSSACGRVCTPVPNPVGSLVGFLPTAPGLLRYRSQLKEVQVQASLVEAANILAADGRRLAGLRNEQGETFTVAEVELPAQRPRPQSWQPRPPVPWLVYWVSDFLLTRASKGTYARGIEKLNRLPFS